MNWMMFIGLAGFFQGISNFSFRQMSVATTSLYALAAFFISTGVLFLGYAAYTRAGEVNRQALLWIGMMSVTIFVANLLLMRGFNMNAPAGIGYLVFNMISLSMVVTLGMVVLGERLNLYGWLGMALAVAAIVLLANGKAV